MPSFLSKVFGRKKDDKESSSQSPTHVADSELLDGKFESVSPSATKFPEAANGRSTGSSKEKEKEAGFALFRSKSPTSASREKSRKPSDVPHLSLNLPGPKDESASRALGVVFEADPDTQLFISDSIIGSRRLNPLETLILVRACSQAIKARGLETLGIMHPHWHSASLDVQKRLISLFIMSLDPKTPITTLSPSPSSLTSAFESEISSTRSPHDVAAVLRWGMRHLQLEGNSFGKEESWYKKFFDAERSSEYPPNAFSKILGPSLPTSHFELLTVTLEIFMSLAAHAEVNGISGSKLSKFLGLWLLTLQRAQESDQWSDFYIRWERAGRMLEHLFLSRIRDEAVGSGMPKRLVELVRNYPYGTSTSDANLLPYLRFSTRRYDALFVRIETELSTTAERPAHHPLRLISEALKAEIIVGSEQNYASLWETIKKTGTADDNSSPGSYPGLSRVFADETIRFLALVPIRDDDKEPASPFSLRMDSGRKRSFSLGEKDAPITSSMTNIDAVKPATKPDVNTSGAIGTDWATFSTSGFFEGESEKIPLATTLLDKQKDMEVTISKVSSSRAKPLMAAFVNGRKSLDAPRTRGKAEETKPEEARPVSKTTRVSLIQLDEAFIDFWSDALVDPITSNWPAFVVCKIKPTLPGIEAEGKRLEWLVIEQAFKRPQPTTPISPETSTSISPDSTHRPRPSSPKSEISFNSARKRFSFFTSGRLSEKGTKRKTKAGKGPPVGEMGEVLAEEEENKGHQDQAKKEEAESSVVKVRVPSPKPKKSVEVSRKSVEAAKKSHEGESRTAGIMATGLAAGAAAISGAGLVAATEDAAKPDAAASESHPTNGAVPENQTEVAPETFETEASSEPPATVQEPPSTSPPVDEATPKATPSQLQEPLSVSAGTDDSQTRADHGTTPSVDLVAPSAEQAKIPDQDLTAESAPASIEPETTIPESAPRASSPTAAPQEPEVVESMDVNTTEQTGPEPRLASATNAPEVNPSIPASDEIAELTLMPPTVETNGTTIEPEKKPSEPETQPLSIPDVPAEELTSTVPSGAAGFETAAETSSPEIERTVAPEKSEILEADSDASETLPDTAAALDVSSQGAALSEETKDAEPTHIKSTSPAPDVHVEELVPETEVTDHVLVDSKSTEITTTSDQAAHEDKEAVPAFVEDSVRDEHITPSEEQPSLPTEHTPSDARIEEETLNNASIPNAEPDEPAPLEDEAAPLASVEERAAFQEPQADDEGLSTKPEVEITEPGQQAVSQTDAIRPASEPETQPTAEEPPMSVTEGENEEPASVDAEAGIEASSEEHEAQPAESTPAVETEAEAAPAVPHSEPINNSLEQDSADASADDNVRATTENNEAQMASGQEPTPVEQPDSEADQAAAHSEPISVPEEGDADKGVTLPDVPIVEVEATAPMEKASVAEGSGATDATEAETAPTVETIDHAAAEPEKASAVQAVMSAGNTPGPQSVLDSVVDPVSEPLSPANDVTHDVSDSKPLEEPKSDNTSEPNVMTSIDDEPSVPPIEAHAMGDVGVAHSTGMETLTDDEQRSDTSRIVEPSTAVEKAQQEMTDKTATQPDSNIPQVHDDTNSTPPPSQEQT